MTARMVSYSQNGEDVVLSRAFPQPMVGFYVDVGANDPVHDSVTKVFYDRGWRGINIEPVPSVYASIEAARPEDVNLNVGVSDRAGTLTMHEFADASAVSTFSPQLNEQWTGMGYTSVTRDVPVVTLSAIFEEHVGDRVVDFLKVDVEGYEQQVFEGFDLRRWRPRVLVAEQNYHETWEPAVTACGYTRVLYDGLNYFFVRDEDLDALAPAFSRPASVALDAFDPWHYIRQLEAASATINELRSELDAARSVQAAPPARRSPLDALRRRAGG